MGRLSTAYRQKQRAGRSKTACSDYTKNHTVPAKKSTEASGDTLAALINKSLTFLGGVATFVNGVVTSILEAVASAYESSTPAMDESAGVIDGELTSIRDITNSQDGRGTVSRNFTTSPGDVMTPVVKEATSNEEAMDFKDDKTALFVVDDELCCSTITRKARKKEKRRIKKKDAQAIENHEAYEKADASYDQSQTRTTDAKQSAKQLFEEDTSTETQAPQQCPQQGVQDQIASSNTSKGASLNLELHRRSRKTKIKQKRRDKERAKKEAAIELAAEEAFQQRDECMVIVFEDDPHSIFQQQTTASWSSWFSMTAWSELWTPAD